MGKPTTPPAAQSSSELMASGALAGSSAVGQSNVGGGAAVGQSQPAGPSGMLPFEGKNLELPNANVDDLVKIAGTDSLFSPINQGGGPFGQSLTTQLGDSAGFLGTPEAKGQPGLSLETLGRAERAAPPTVQGDLQLKSLSAKGSSGAGQGA